MLIQQYPLLYEVVRWVGVGYLLYLACEGWQTEKGNFARARRSYDYGGPPIRTRLPLKCVQSKIHFVFCVSASHVRRNRTNAPSLPIQMAVFHPICRISHRDPWGYRGPRSSTTAMAGGGPATADCAPYPVRSTGAGRDLAGVDHAALTGQKHIAACSSNPSSAKSSSFSIASGSLSAPEFIQYWARLGSRTVRSLDQFSRRRWRRAAYRNFLCRDGDFLSGGGCGVCVYPSGLAQGRLASIGVAP